MTTTYLLGIDNGGTMSKAALFTSDGTEVAVAGRKVAIIEAKPGWSERDMDAMWTGTAEAIREVIAKARIDPAAIAAVACTGHGNGIYLIDAAGKPVRNAINSSDQRAAAYIDGWIKAGVNTRVLPRTTQCLWPAQPNALLAWLRDNEPDNLKKSTAVLMAKDFVRFRLTGQVQAELTDMSGCSLMNVVTAQYDDSVLEDFGLSDMKRLLPPLVRTAEVCGTVTAAAAAATGLKAGTPVAGGMFDIDACGLAAGLTDERLMTLVAGTWGNNMYIARKPLIDPKLFMTSCYSIDGYYLMLEGSPTSASNLEWLVGTFLGEAPTGGKSIYHQCDELVAGVSDGDAPPVFLPFLYGCNVEPKTRGALLGLEGWHSRAHVLRAVYEGVVFGHFTHYQRLLNFREAPAAIRFTGGAARSRVWVQMFADCFQVPMEIPAGTEFGALGAAIAAAVATRVHPDWATAVKAMTGIARRQDPDPSRAGLFAARFDRYRTAIRALSGF